MQTKKIYYISLLLFVLLAQNAIAQFKTPLFEMPIYFEDAKGHKDSIVMGFDENADFEEIDSLFGEDKLLTAFDSIFDVRLVKSTSAWDSPATGKKRVARQEKSNSNYGGFKLSILINARYNPIKISYFKDLTKLEKPYMFNTIVAKTSEVFLKENGWYKAKDWVCLAGQNKFSIDMSKKDGGGTGNFRKYRVVGENDLKAIKFLYLTQFGSGPTCAELLSDENFMVLNITTYPNPVQNELHFMLADNVFGLNTSYQIFDINGKVMQKQAITNSDVNIDVQNLSQGMYFIKIHNADKILANARFVKIE
jgi:hypothetical protein